MRLHPFTLYLVALCLLTLLVVPFPTAASRIEAPAAPPRTTVLGYSREQFGPGWAPQPGGCTTRTAALAKAFDASTCATPPREWEVAAIVDPYTGHDITPGDVELDHLLPLSAAWDLGAYAWTEHQRVAFANDPRNLVVTSAAANQEKSDKLPSEWLPPDWRARCAYARRLVAVARAYNLAVPQPDLRASRRACSGVAGLASRRTLTAEAVP
ncbi:HNH endonuclease family protein [Corynebacterium auris]|uniref:HNH endonuclease family protein n=1 Tax=Corynebacterium auris TaxID=44750 RepID=UPI0025B38CB9|nr:HNH endonuclease family protein [Corynebacterium auris]WJY67797.1 hypothetical protein CAURIS_04405 [Corynebacterium auris]